MSSNISAVEVDDNSTDESEDTNSTETKEMENGVILTKDKFAGRDKTAGKFNGLTFWVPSWKTLDNAIAHFTKLSKNGKPGEEIILDLLHAAVSFRMRNRATAELNAIVSKDNKDKIQHVIEAHIKDLLDKGEPIISEADALAFIPGEREVSTINGLRRQLGALFNAIKDAKEKGVEKSIILAQLAKYKEVKAAIDAEEAKEMAKLDELAEGLDLDTV